MDFIKKAVGADSDSNQNNQHQNSQNQHQSSSSSGEYNQQYNSNSNERKEESGGFLSGIGEKLSGGSGGGKEYNQHSSEKKEEGGFLAGIGEKLNGAAGGGKESEKNEDYLDKGVDFVQQHILGQGPQDNESAIEQAKDEKISDFIRGQYKNTTGKDVPIEDKKTTWG